MELKVELLWELRGRSQPVVGFCVQGASGILLAEAQAHLDRCAEQEEEQVEEREAWDQGRVSVGLLRTGRDHHVDHQGHDGEAEDQAEQEGVPPSGGGGKEAQGQEPLVPVVPGTAEPGTLTPEHALFTCV